MRLNLTPPRTTCKGQGIPPPHPQIMLLPNLHVFELAHRLENQPARIQHRFMKEVMGVVLDLTAGVEHVEPYLK